MAGYVLAAGEAQPDKSALEVLGPESTDIWSYGDLRRAVLATAGGLQAMGLSDGARILLRLGNQVDFPIMFLAAIASGYIPVPTSGQLTAPEVTALIGDIAPSLVVFGAQTARMPVACNSLGPDDLAPLRRHSAGRITLGDPDRLAYIIMTSGNSGRPHAVMHAHRAVWARRMMWQGWYGLTPHDRLLHAGAFNWSYTLGTGMMDPWAIGATALIAQSSVESRNLPALLASRKASIFAAVPGVYRQILKHHMMPDLPSLRHGLSAGEKLSPTIRAAWQAATRTPIYEALGMSEVSTFVSASPAHPAPGATSGRPQQGRRIAVLSPTTFAPVDCGQPGILAVSRRDPGLMLGYLNAPDKTAAKFHGDWFLTGDTVAMDQDANVTYLGRNDDMMNAGGYRVSPIEVESVLNAHPDIIEAAAVAVLLKADTYVIAAFYQSDIDLAEADLAAYCATRLARYKCPRLFIRVTQLPKGANNKLKRGDLRAGFRGKHDQT